MSATAKRILLVTALFGSSLLAGCAAPPRLKFIEKQFSPPRTVVLEQIPELRVGAFIGVPVLPAFTSAGDLYFRKPEGVVPTPGQADVITDLLVQQIAIGPPMSIGGAAAASAVAGLIGAIMQVKAEDTQKKAMGFHEEMKQRLPWVDLGEDFMKGVRQSLEAEGIRVEMSSATYPVRVRWPVPDEYGTKYEAQPGDLPAVDADLYVQINPRAVLSASGPLNAYAPLAGATLLVFDGRTREPLLKQYFGAQEWGNALAHSYSDLLEHPEKPITELHRVLMGLVPQVVHVISAKPGEPPKPATATTPLLPEILGSPRARAP